MWSSLAQVLANKGLFDAQAKVNRRENRRDKGQTTGSAGQKEAARHEEQNRDSEKKPEEKEPSVNEHLQTTFRFHRDA